MDEIRHRLSVSDKLYDSAENEAERKLIFAENLKMVESHNYLFERGLESFSMGINQFSDMVSSLTSSKL